MKSLNNKWAIVKPGVILTNSIDRAILELEAVCAAAGRKMYITSGQRPRERQLKIIRDYAVAYALDKQHPQAMTCQIEDKDADGHFVWQQLWSKLCNIGLIIAPPIACVALYDYNYFGRNLKGLVCPASNHIPGFAFDVDGEANGIEDETKLVEQALKEGKLPSVINIVSERKNNCLHFNCKP